MFVGRAPLRWVQKAAARHTTAKSIRQRIAVEDNQFRILTGALTATGETHMWKAWRPITSCSEFQRYLRMARVSRLVRDRGTPGIRARRGSAASGRPNRSGQCRQRPYTGSRRLRSRWHQSQNHPLQRDRHSCRSGRLSQTRGAGYRFHETGRAGFWRNSNGRERHPQARARGTTAALRPDAMPTTSIRIMSSGSIEGRPVSSERCQPGLQMADIENRIDLAQQMPRWDAIVQAELIKQLGLISFKAPHHRSIPTLTLSESRPSR